MSDKKKYKGNREEIARQKRLQKQKEEAMENPTVQYLMSDKPIAKILNSYSNKQIDKTKDLMRTIRARLHAIELARLNAKSYEDQIKNNDITQINKETNTLYTEEELQLKLIGTMELPDIHIDDIQSNIIKLLSHIGVTLTEDEFEEYVKLVNDKIESFGYKLFSENIKEYFPTI